MSDKLKICVFVSDPDRAEQVAQSLPRNRFQLVAVHTLREFERLVENTEMTVVDTVTGREITRHFEPNGAFHFSIPAVVLASPADPSDNWLELGFYDTSRLPVNGDELATRLVRGWMIRKTLRDNVEVGLRSGVSLLGGGDAMDLDPGTDPESVIHRVYAQLREICPIDLFAVLLIFNQGVDIYICSLRPISLAVRRSITHRLMSLYEVEPNMPALDETLKFKITVLDGEDESGSEPLLDVTLLDLAPMVDATTGTTVGYLLPGILPEKVPESAWSDYIRSSAGSLATHLRKLQRIQESNYRHLSTIVQKLPEGVVLLDKKMRVIMANPEGVTCLRLLADVSKGDTVRYLGSRPVYELTDNATHEIHITEPQDRIYHVRIQKVAGYGWLMVVMDITEEREVQQAISARDRLASVGQMAAGVAHDFNNYLTSIMGYAQLLQLRTDLPGPAQDDITQILSESSKAVQMIRQILDFSRKSPALRSPVDFCHILENTCSLIRRTLPENILLTLKMPPGRHIVNAEVSAIQQMFTNLIMNARDAMDSGGDIGIMAEARTYGPEHERPFEEMPAGNWLVIAVTDTGTGIPPDVMPYIFDPFYTTKHPTQGTGLGLSQVYGLIKQHDGYIEVDSQLTRGTTVSLYLPLLRVEQAPQEPRKKVDHSMDGSGETLLLVEDDESVLRITRRLLERLNYRVITAGNGQEALDIFLKNRAEIQLIITDMVMPVMGGLQLVEHLRAKKVPFRAIVLSGYPLETGWEKIWGPGVEDWITKPPVLADIREKIAAVLQGDPPR